MKLLRCCSPARKREDVFRGIGKECHPFFFASGAEGPSVVSKNQMWFSDELNPAVQQFGVGRLNVVNTKIHGCLWTRLFQKQTCTGEVEENQAWGIIFG